jgi:Uma2 family endonuclease
MAATLTHRFSVADYFRMAESGILPHDVRVELIGGEVIDMSPIGPFHSGSVNELARQFAIANGGDWWLSIQAPLDLGPNDLPEPDLALLRPAEHRYREAHPRAEDVFLLVEVADSSLGFDRAVKLPLYARHGIPEVWILNAPQRRLEVYRQPGPEGYAAFSHLGEGVVAPAAFPGVAIDLDRLLG